MLRNRIQCLAAVACLVITMGPMSTALAVSSDPMSDYLLYGIEADTGQLIRHTFADDNTAPIGSVQDSTGKLYLGIEGSTHIPGHMNIISFWTDPSDNQARRRPGRPRRRLERADYPVRRRARLWAAPSGLRRVTRRAFHVKRDAAERIDDPRTPAEAASGPVPRENGAQPQDVP